VDHLTWNQQGMIGAAFARLFSTNSKTSSSLHPLNVVPTPCFRRRPARPISEFISLRAWRDHLIWRERAFW
jgi:hypothetical protein